MINGLNELLVDAMTKLKTLIDVDSVVGQPIASNGNTVLPVSKLSFGFVTGGSDKKESEKNDNSKLPDTIAAIGGGVTVTPLGFLVIAEEDIYFIKTQGDNVNKWLDIVQSALRSVKK